MLGLRTFQAHFLVSLQPLARRCQLAAFVAVLLFPIALLVDVPIARFCLADRIWGDLQRVVQWAEVAAHGFGVAILAIFLYVIDLDRRRYLPRVLAAAYGAGLVADLGKLMVARLRPRHLPLDASVGDSFQAWCPLLFPVEGKRILDSASMSLPSGHAAVAVAFAIGLSIMYPRGRALFGALAAVSIFQRIESGAHFVSDTLVGSAIGFLIAAVCSDPRLLGRYFDRLEAKRPRNLE